MHDTAESEVGLRLGEQVVDSAIGVCANFNFADPGSVKLFAVGVDFSW